MLAQLDRPFVSVSLFGSYRPGHLLGVDARDLSRFGKASFAAVYGCLLYDYFPEHEQALSEAFRVTAPGGWLLLHIANFRVTEDEREPEIIRTIEPAPGFYDYLPEGAGMSSVRVGGSWFLDAMRAAGYREASRTRYVDEASAVPCDWFEGRKLNDAIE